MVLAVLATQVATRAGYRKATRSRVKFHKRLLLHRVIGDGTRPPIDIRNEASALIATASAEAPLPFAQRTSMRTEVAPNGSIIQSGIISTLHQNTIAS
jgi:hypothetical protein